MTDRPSDHTAPDDRDLLVSAYVDDEATPAERAEIEADPALLERAERFRVLKHGLADVAPLDATRRDSILAAALAARTDEATSPSTSPSTLPPPAGDVVTPMTRPPAPSRRRPRWLGAAAAAVAIVAAGTVVATQLGGGDSDNEAGDAGAPPSLIDDGVADDGVADDADAPTQEAGPDDEESNASGTEDDSENSVGAVPGTAERQGDSAAPPAVGPTEHQVEPPDDGGTVTTIESGRDLIAWYDDVESGAIDPAGAGSTRCGEELVGWTEIGSAAYGDIEYLVVAQTAEDRLVGYDAATCDTVVIVQIP